MVNPTTTLRKTMVFLLYIRWFKKISKKLEALL